MKHAAGGSDGPMELDWSLDELPSSQHKTGLVGLVLLVRWLERKNAALRRGILSVEVGPSAAKMTIDREGLAWLFDEAYAASEIESEYDKPRKGEEPLRVIEREVEEKRGRDKKTGKPKVKLQKKYIYPVVQPRGAFLVEEDPGGVHGPWIKLWRDFIWGILRAVPATREPYNARAKAEATDDAEVAWIALSGIAPRSVELPSTYFVGAQATTAEKVDFRDRARFQFLLHFWPFAVGLAVPMTIDRDGKSEFQGYVLSFSDVIDLREFCDECESMLRGRSPEIFAYLPRQVVVDLPAEGGLQFLNALRERLAATESKKRTRDLVHGVDVFHLEREGNNVRVRSTVRIEPADRLQDEYARIRQSCKDAVFRRQLLINLLAGRDWSNGFDRLFATMPYSTFLRGRSVDGHFPPQFSFDVQREFKHHEYEVTDV